MNAFLSQKMIILKEEINYQGNFFYLRIKTRKHQFLTYEEHHDCRKIHYGLLKLKSMCFIQEYYRFIPCELYNFENKY